MKTLCITGATSTYLESIAGYLQRGGLRPACAPDRDPAIDFDAWHTHVAPMLRDRRPIGRLWERLAGDLLLANLPYQLWGWHGTDSLWALDFWADFEPSIAFLLVCTRPEDELVHCLLQQYQQENLPEDESLGYLEAWRQRHQHMLDFYLHHPERCLMVEARQANQYPEALSLALRERLELPVSVSSYKKLPNAMAPLGMQNSLVELIARELFKEREARECQALYQEIRAAQYPLAPVEDTEESGIEKPKLTELVQNYRSLYRATLATEKQEALSQQVKELEDARALDERRHHDTKQALQQSHQERDEALACVSRIEKQYTRLQQECETLLLSLHEAQESLEHQLRVQQTLSQQHDQLTQRWQTLIQRYPNLTIYDSCKVTSIAEGETRWQFEKPVLMGQELTYLEVTTRLIPKQMNAEEGHLEILFAPQKGSVPVRLMVLENPELCQTWQRLTQSQWEIACQVPVLLQQALADSGHGKFEQQRLTQALGAIQQHLQIQPPALRFDDIELLNAQVNPDYEHLWLELYNIGWGSEKLTSWQLRISCANVTSDAFGRYPKLEVPQQSSQWLDSWFEESRDDHGGKWELRFALPNAMDTGVWKALSDSDQQRLDGFFHALPEMLERLAVSSSGDVRRNWQDWQQLVGDMQRIKQAVLK